MNQPLQTATAFQLVARGVEGDVRLAGEAFAEYQQVIDGNDQISSKRRAHLTRYFAEFCSQREFWRRLSDEKFKKEDNLPDGMGGQVAIWAFKSWQWRLYGAILTVDEKRCFVGVCVDASKKQNRADQTLLRKAAKEIAALVEYRAKAK